MKLIWVFQSHQMNSVMFALVRLRDIVSNGYSGLFDLVGGGWSS